MVAASLLPYRRDRSQLTVIAIVFATLLIVLALLACGVILAVGMVDSSPVDVRLVAPFRWGSGMQLDFA